jgi:putative transposase
MLVNPPTLRRSYKFLLRPTRRQAGLLTRMLENHRELYNAALEERREAWRRARVSISFYDQDRQLKEVRRLRPDLAVWAFASERGGDPPP